MNPDQTPDRFDPSDHDDLDRRVAGLLHGRLDPLGASVDLTAPVIARSRRIRRNRAIATTAAMTVAALAVATPLAWSALRGGPLPEVPATSSTGSTSVVTTTEEPTAVPTTSATPTGTATTTPPTSQPQTSQPEPTTAPTFDIPDGATKTVSADASFAKGQSGGAVWSNGKTIHRDGRTFTLDVGERWDYVPLAQGNGLVVDGEFQAERTVKLVGPDGDVVRELLTIPASLALHTVMASADGSRVALYASRDVDSAANDARIYAWDTSGRQVATKDNLVHTAHLAGWHDGRLFLGNREAGHSYTWDLGTNVIDNYYNGGAMKTVGESGRGATYEMIGEGFTGCTEALDVTGATARVLSRQCGDFQGAHSVGALSPDGRYLVGADAYADGPGPGVVRVLDTTTGRVVLDLTDGLFPKATFLADGTLAVDVLRNYGSGAITQFVVRCSLAGECTRVSDEVSAPDDLSPPLRLLH